MQWLLLLGVSAAAAAGGDRGRAPASACQGISAPVSRAVALKARGGVAAHGTGRYANACVSARCVPHKEASGFTGVEILLEPIVTDEWVAWDRVSIPAVFITKGRGDTIKKMMNLESIYTPGLGDQLWCDD